MKRGLLVALAILLGAVVLALISNVIADFIDLPLWATVLIGGAALAGLIAVTLSLRRGAAQRASRSTLARARSAWR